MQSVDRRRLAQWLDRRSVRVTLALVAGLPGGAFVVVYGLLGLAVALGGLGGGTSPVFFLGLLALTSLGILGVAGAWLRLLEGHSTMSARTRRITVALVLCGVTSALFLAGYLVLGERSLAGGAIAFLAALTGIFFIAGTPPANAKPVT